MLIKIKRKNIDDAWQYEDPNELNAALILDWNGFSLEHFDTFLESISGSPRAEQLYEWRSHAIHATTTNNQHAAEGWTCALLASWFEYLSSEDLQPLAREGKKFRVGRKSGTQSPLRKLIAKLLKKNPKLKNKELLELVKSKPPKGYAYYENRQGKYFEGKDNKTTEIRRFNNICSEERSAARKVNL